MNTELLQRVKAAILAEPESFDMALYFDESENSPCGTVACIAGHALAIHFETTGNLPLARKKSYELSNPT